MGRTVARAVAWALAAAALGLTIYAGARWRDLRDGWRVARVRARPGYAELRRRWQRIAQAYETLHWPQETGTEWPQKVPELRKAHGEWTGAAAFFDELRLLTDNAEDRARADLGGTCIAEKCSMMHDDRAVDALMAMRSRGGLSDGTFARAMLILARQRDYCFLNDLDPDALRVGLVVLCDLVGDGEHPQARVPARDLDEAFDDVARTRTAWALCQRWKQMLVSPRVEVEAMLKLKQLRRQPPRHELEAYAILTDLSEGTCTLTRHLRPGGAPDSEWSEGLPDRSEILPRPCRIQEEPVNLRTGRRQPGRDEILAAAQAEAGHLPPELRRAYRAVLRELLRNRATKWRVVMELGNDREELSGPPSPTLRLVAAIIRNWG